jgi:adenine-specific DNA glycosylase
MGAADTAIVRTSLLDADLGALNAGVPELRQLLLRWWESHGRHSIPWKLRPDGLRPVPGEPLDPYGIWVAEMMRAARQHSSRVSPAPLRWTEAVPTPGADCVSGW